MKRRLVRRLSLEQLERREVLSVTFVEHVVASEPEGYNDQGVQAADIDGDHDTDILASLGDRIVWYENIDGRGTFGDERLVTDDNSRAPLAEDLDGDGDEDVVTPSRAGALGWYENIDGQGAFGSRRAIAEGGVAISSLSATDFDNDGDSDLLVVARSHII